MEFLSVRLQIPEGANLILGQSHFIKTAEDLYEVVVNTVPGAKFAVAFNEASSPCLVRVESNDDELRAAAVANAQAIAAGHAFVLLIRQAYPINLLSRVRDCFEVCTVFCATANPVDVIVAQTEQGPRRAGRHRRWFAQRALRVRKTQSDATASSAKSATSSDSLIGKMAQKISNSGDSGETLVPTYSCGNPHRTLGLEFTRQIHMAPSSTSLTQESPAISGVHLRMSDLISALSLALDLTEGQPMGHAVKSCLLGMRIAEILKLSVEQRSDLYYALLLKDAGCSSNATRMYEIFGGDERAAKKEVKTTDWSRVTFDGLEYLMRNVMPGKSRLDRVIAIAHIAINRKDQSTELFQLRCERGGQIAKKIGLTASTAEAIFSLDEHWDGNGFPHGLKHADIPLLSRIMNLCQTLEVFSALSGPQDAFQVIQERSGTWFDPEMVKASLELEGDAALWELLETDEVRATVMKLEPADTFQFADDARIESVCEAFADVIDVKSLTPTPIQGASPP